MKVTSSPALPLVLLLIACSSASPMFGTGGMMSRKFPGATDMSYKTYMDIAKSNAAAAASGVAARPGGASVASRIGGSGSGDTAWMFGNEFVAPSVVASANQAGSFTQSGLPFNQQQPSSYQQQPSFNQQQPSSYQQQPSFNQQQPFFNQQQGTYNQQGLPFYPHDFQGIYQGRYPSVFEPRESYAPLQFPYHAPTPLDYDQVFVPQNKIYNDYY